MGKIDTVITIGLLVIYFVFTLKKKKSKATAEEVFPTESKEIFSETQVPNSYTGKLEYESTIAENQEKYSKIDNYFTYDKIETNNNESLEDLDFQNKSNVAEIEQDVENEDTNAIEFDFSNQEIIKGIIYGEILKRPYN